MAIRSRSVSTCEASRTGTATSGSSMASFTTTSWGMVGMSFRLCERAARTRVSTSRTMTRRMSSVRLRCAAVSSPDSYWCATLRAVSTLVSGEGSWSSRATSVWERVTGKLRFP